MADVKITPRCLAARAAGMSCPFWTMLLPAPL